MADDNPLTVLKKELRSIVDEAFGFMWQEIEAKMKESYRNGITEGERRGNGDSKGETPSGSKRSWGTRRKE